MVSWAKPLGGLARILAYLRCVPYPAFCSATEGQSETPSPDAEAEGEAWGEQLSVLAAQVCRHKAFLRLRKLPPPPLLPGLKLVPSPQGLHFNVNETKKVGNLVFL